MIRCFRRSDLVRWGISHREPLGNIGDYLNAPGLPMKSSGHLFDRLSGVPRSVAVSILLLALFPCSTSRSAAQERPRILMLHAFNYTLAGTTISATAARQRLVDTLRGRVDIDADFLD